MIDGTCVLVVLGGLPTALPCVLVLRDRGGPRLDGGEAHGTRVVAVVEVLGLELLSTVIALFLLLDARPSGSVLSSSPASDARSVMREDMTLGVEEGA